MRLRLLLPLGKISLQTVLAANLVSWASSTPSSYISAGFFAWLPWSRGTEP